jgi:hypothetical protein
MLQQRFGFGSDKSGGAGRRGIDNFTRSGTKMQYFFS